MRVIGPACAASSLAPGEGKNGTRPNDGLCPTMPQKLAGMRIEPAPSVPSESGVRPAATAAPAPPLEPPAVRVRSHGLRVSPKRRLSVEPRQAYSGVLVRPTMIAPEAAIRAPIGEVSRATLSRSRREP